MAALLFLVGMVIAQIGYGSSYSLIQNHISDLGALHCSTLSTPGGGGGYLYNGYVCSPWHDIFNATIIVEGVLLGLGVILIRRAFPSRAGLTIGFTLLMAAGVGSVGVGVFPEDSILILHSLSAALVFLAGNLALIILGFSKFTDTKLNLFRAYSILSGSVGLTAFVLFLTMVYGALGVGGMERLIVAPLLLWVVVTSARLVRSDRGHLPSSLDSAEVPMIDTG